MLTFGLQTPRDLLEKLKRDAALLNEEVTGDRFFNFVVTGYSVIDWVKNGASIPATAQTAVSAMYRDPWIKICGDIATAGKHFKLTRRIPVTASVDSTQGFGIGRFGKGGGGTGEENIQIELTDGSSIAGLELVENVIRVWDAFFQSHGL
jgi:hypothetical protein